MGWHDATIHAIAHLEESYELALDIDYVLEWVGPEEDGYYRFWVAPATLVFENVTRVHIDLEPYGPLGVDGLVRGEPEPTRPGFEGPAEQWPWTVDCNQGEITLRATGFRQVVRQAPTFMRGQRLGFAARGGISFSQDPHRGAAV